MPRVWRKDPMEAVLYDGTNLAEVLELVGDVPHRVDETGELWIFNVYGQSSVDGKTLAMRLLPRGWWLVRGPGPGVLTPRPPDLMALYYESEDGPIIPGPLGNRAKTAHRKRLDETSDEDYTVAALGDYLGRKATLDDLHSTVDVDDG